MKKEYYHLLDEIKNFFKRSHQKKAVLGLSGGLDSAVCLKLVATALGSKNVTALLMPEKGLTKEKNVKDAESLAQKMKTRYYTIDINPYLE